MITQDFFLFLFVSDSCQILISSPLNEPSASNSHDAKGHTLITCPPASEWIHSYATPQCVGMQLTFYIIQVT